MADRNQRGILGSKPAGSYKHAVFIPFASGPSSRFKNPPGEGTGPTRDGVSPVILVGCVPSRGVLQMPQQAARRDSFP